MDFSYNLPINLNFGLGKISLVGKVCKKYGSTPLVVISGGSAKKSGLYDKVLKLLKAEGLIPFVFDKIPQNPLSDTVNEAVAVIKEHNCDMVLGVGGGSVMDTAKAAAFCAVNSGDLADYIYGLKKGQGALPIVLSPTTCGTGSEGNQIAVITNTKTLDKKALYTMEILPSESIIDPELMMTVPPSVLSSVGFDAFTHALEAFTAKKANPLTDMQALSAMELIVTNLPLVLKDSSNTAAWEGLSLGATLGGMVIGAAGVNAAHGMEHPVSGLKNVVHGKGLAALTPVINEYFVSAGVLNDKFTAVSKILGGSNSDDFVSSLRAFLCRIDLSVSLTDLGITESDIEWLTENCEKIAAGNLANAPVVFGKETLAEIYRKAL